LIKLNGRNIDTNDLGIHSIERLWSFGDGIFETIKVSQFSPLLFDLHIGRLNYSIKLLNWEKLELKKDEIRQDIIDLCKHLNYANARVKLFIYRDTSGTYLPDNLNKYSILITAKPLTESQYKLNTKGLRIGIFTKLPKTSDYLSNIKTVSAIKYTQAAVYAQQMGWDDVLLLNQKGNVCEANASNIFICKHDEIITPPLSEYCLYGVMRQHLINIAQQNNVNIIEKPLSLKDIYDSESVFLTNTIKGIQWVEEFNHKRYNFNTIISKLHLLINDINQCKYLLFTFVIL
jgi:branched-chain amino acid aminotransferase